MLLPPSSLLIHSITIHVCCTGPQMSQPRRGGRRGGGPPHRPASAVAPPWQGRSLIMEIKPWRCMQRAAWRTPRAAPRRRGSECTGAQYVRHGRLQRPLPTAHNPRHKHNSHTANPRGAPEITWDADTVAPHRFLRGRRRGWLLALASARTRSQRRGAPATLPCPGPRPFAPPDPARNAAMLQCSAPCPTPPPALART